MACLNGIDEVAGLLDLEAGAILIEPIRDAPPIIVTESSFMVASGMGAINSWDEVPWPSGTDAAALVPIFGEVLAGYISDGIRIPDLNLTALAAIDVAAAVEPSTPPSGITGDTFTVTIDPDRYIAELRAEGVDTTDDLARVPTVSVTVDSTGLVTALVVETSSATFDDGAAYGDGYVLIASYGDVDPIIAPAADAVRPANVRGLDYPTPEQSCGFRS